MAIVRAAWGTRLAVASAVAAALAAAAWWGIDPAPAGPEARIALKATPPMAEPKPPGLAAAPVEAAPTPLAPASPARVPACPHQQLLIRSPDGNIAQACVGTTRMVQNGGLRTYVLLPEGVSRWRLEVDMAGGEVLAARLAEGGGAPHGCTAPGCGGIAWGTADRHGRRTLAVDQALAVPAPQTAARPLRLTASLTVGADAQDDGIACQAPAVTLVDGRGGQSALCPAGSAGMAVLEDGLRRYAFEDVEGRQIAITLAPDDTVQAVALNGWRCTAPACGGIGVQAAGEPAATARAFSFSGVALQSLHGAGGVTLNGHLAAP